MVKIMKEHELSKFGKIASILIFVIPAIISAIVNIATHTVPNPWAFFVVIIGFALFLFAKISVIRKKKLVSFGTSYMTEGMANLYRLGYWLMVFGILLTFVKM